MAGIEREDGIEYSTPVVEFLACEWCDKATPVRATGRRPRFCGPECRLAHHRARQRVERAYAELLEAETALETRGREQELRAAEVGLRTRGL